MVKRFQAFQKNLAFIHYFQKWMTHSFSILILSFSLLGVQLCVLTCRNLAPAYRSLSNSLTHGASSSFVLCCLERKYLSKAKQECTTFEPQIEFQENLNQPKTIAQGAA